MTRSNAKRVDATARRREGAPDSSPGAPPPASAGARPGASPVYLYGIVRWPTPWARSSAQVTKALGPGVGDPPSAVVVLPDGALAALVSRVDPRTIGSAGGVRGLRRDMRAHSNVLNRVVALGGTMLPAAFGLVFPQGDQLADRFLKPRHRVLDAHLTRLGDAVEVKLKATYVEGQALAEVVAEAPHLARPTGRSLESKIEQGKRVAEALRAKRDRDARQVLSALAPTVRDAKVNDPGAEMQVLSASLLVPRDALPKFDRALAQVTRDARGRMQFDCVGPLPPYSFVDLRL